MRTIKFRAWDGKHKEMKLVDSLLRSGEVMCGDEAFKPDALMQFTGLLDKNGKEIYEGDVVDSPVGPAKVEWHVDGWCVGKTLGSSYPPLCEWGESELEIIGNIYENPELLANKPE